MAHAPPGDFFADADRSHAPGIESAPSALCAPALPPLLQASIRGQESPLTVREIFQRRRRSGRACDPHAFPSEAANIRRRDVDAATYERAEVRPPRFRKPVEAEG